MKRKCLAIGIILLFVTIACSSGINANAVKVNTADNKNNSTMQDKVTVIFIGLIKDMVKIDDNRYEFRFIRAFACAFHDGKYDSFLYINDYNYLVDFTFEIKIGFIRNHIICGVFTYEIYPLFFVI
jgi:hypothetical protein